MTSKWCTLESYVQEFADLAVIERSPQTLACYMLSGGLSLRQLAPGFSYPFFRFVDKALSKIPAVFPLFQTLVVEKK